MVYRDVVRGQRASGLSGGLLAFWCDGKISPPNKVDLSRQIKFHKSDQRPAVTLGGRNIETCNGTVTSWIYSVVQKSETTFKIFK